MDTKQLTTAIDTFVDAKVVPLEPKYKAAVAAAALLLPALLFYFFVYSPKSQEIKRAEAKVTKLERELADIKKKASRLDEHKAMMAEVEQRYQKASQVIPDNKEIPSLLTNISSEGTGAGLDIISFVPGKVAAKEFYAEIPVKLTVTGTYHNVGHFLDTVSKMPRIVNVASVRLGSPKDVSGEMLLNANVDLVTYKFIEPDKQKDKKGGKKKRGRKR